MTHLAPQILSKGMQGGLADTMKFCAGLFLDPMALFTLANCEVMQAQIYQPCQTMHIIFTTNQV